MSTNDSESHDLTTLTTRHHADDWNVPSHNVQELPPVDTGRQAWLFLTACFLAEALVWGFPFSYGVFQVYYRDTEAFASDRTGISAIGTTQTGVMYLLSPIPSLILQRYPRARRPTMVVAAVLMVTSLVAASFCDSVAALVATQGIMYAVGGLLMYFPAVSYVGEWFVSCRGLAYGIMWAGTGSAGIVVPFLLQWLLDRYGFRIALRVWAVVLTLTLPFILLFVKGRLPASASAALRPIDLSFLKHRPFWIFAFGSMGQGLGFWVPTLWMPSFALAIGLPKYAGPLGLALANAANCLGTVLVGLLVDRFHVSVAIGISVLGQMIAIFALWGLTSSQAMLYAFAIMWGTFGGGFSATWTGYAGALKRDGANGGGTIDTTLVVALMGAMKGIGAVVSGPLSEGLLTAGWKSQAHFAYGGTYGGLIVFSGVCASLGGAACVGRALKML